MKASDPAFDFSAYLPILEKEIRSNGLHFEVEAKEKSAESDIKSAFLKGNTKEHMLMSVQLMTENKEDEYVKSKKDAK